MNRRTYTALTLLGCALLIIGGGYVFSRFDLSYGEMKEIFSSSEEFRKFVLRFGVWAPLVFFIAQTLQVIVSPIPGNITGLVGGALFGWVKGFLLNGGGLLLGSIMAFFIARLFGQGIVIRLVGKDIFQKYNNIFHTRFIFGLFLIFLFPFFPDDALCFLAGLSSLPFPVFLLLIIVGRLPGMMVAALVGAGVLVFSFLQWVIIGGISLVAVFLVVKYRGRLEDWFHRLVGMDTRKSN